MKVLLVEDDKDLSKAICMRLASFGYTAIPALDAISAVSEAVKHSPDLTIVDINLPGGDGFTVMERLRATKECATTPSIMITANKQEDLKKKAEAYGASVFLEKPFGASVLLEAIQNATGDMMPAADTISI